MARGLGGRVRLAALILIFGTAVAVSPAQAQLGYPEAPTDVLARNIKVLGSTPKDFDALIGAGRASLALGDTMAAAGFFGRAEEVWPQSPQPQAGMAAAMTLNGDASSALQLFTRAVQLGATQSMIGCDRGLAYDLLGQHERAQADYRAALAARDGDEARRRLALSLAITGDKTEALSTLSPLMARRDAAAGRTRAFVLALSGDVSGARAAIDAAMPGSSAKMGYFFQKLASLRSDQKAAAVNLGMFPGSGVQMASATPVPPPVGAQRVATSGVSVSPEDRMKSIQDWLSEGQTTTMATQPAPVRVLKPQQMASVTLPSTVTSPRRQADGDSSASIYVSNKLWLQLASGDDAAALPREFDRMKRSNRDLFEGISGFVFEDGRRARLLIGPFRNSEEAGIFADDLASVHIDAFTWTSQAGQTIRKLPSE